MIGILANKNFVIFLFLFNFSVASSQPVSVVITEIADGLSNGVGLTNAGDGSNRLFAIQKTGEIIIWDGSQFLATPFLNLNALVSSGNEQGLLGLVFHPNYTSNGYFYVNYINLAGDTVVSRYQVSSSDINNANPASAQQVLSIVQPSPNHNGGDMHFANDGYLYIATGEGGAAGASPAQDKNNLLGKILRIDVNGDDFPLDSSNNYAIPANNPFVGVAGADEVWLMGLRNPWRFSFDRQNGDIFIGDVGEGAWEEVNYLAAAVGGENFGWPCYEGVNEFDLTGCTSMGDYLFSSYSIAYPNNTCAVVIGGFNFRDSNYPALNNWYFFSDWCTGILWASEVDSSNSWSAFNVGSMGTFFITGFGEGENGELYVISNWKIFQITSSAVDAVFANGFEF